MPSTTAAAKPPKYGEPGGPTLSLDLNNPAPMNVPSAPILGAGDLALQKAQIRGVNDAGAGRAIAGTSARLGGDHSSPLFSILAGMHQGGAAAATATAGADLTYKNAKEGRDYGMQQLAMQMQKYMFDRQQQLAESSDKRADGAFNIQQLLARLELERARTAQPGAIADITRNSNAAVQGGTPLTSAQATAADYADQWRRMSTGASS